MNSQLSKAEDKHIERLLAQRNFEHSAKLIHQKISDNPNSDAYYLLGVWHYFQGQIAPTIDALKKSLELDPRHTDAAICLSVLYNDIGRYDEAKNVFEAANQSLTQRQTFQDASINKKFAVKHLELADLYMRYRRYNEAIDEYSKASSLDPLTLDIRLKRAKAFSKKGLTTRCIQELQQLKKDHPGYLPARIQLGLIYFGEGNILEADVEWEQVLDIDPDNREAKSYMEMARR